MHSKETWKVTGGKMHHVNTKGERVTLTEGETFHPTRRQVKGGSLEGKAVKVKGGTSVSTSGADIGIRALEWGSKPALKKALDAEPPVTVEELEAGDGPSGETGYVTADVTAVLDARAAAEQDEEPDESDGDADAAEGEDDGQVAGSIGPEDEEASDADEPDESGGGEEGEETGEGEGESEEGSSEEEPEESGGD